MNFKMLAAAAAALSFGASAQAAEFVINGDFEQVAQQMGKLDPTGKSFEFGDTYNYGQAVVGWTSTTVAGATAGAFNIYFLPEHAAVNSSGGPQSPDTRYTASEVQYLWKVPGAGAVSPTGGAFLGLDGDVLARGRLSQTINGLTVGQTYHLSFDWAAAQFRDRDGDTTEQLQIKFGGDTFNTAIVANPEHQAQGWFHVTHDFKATSTSQVLSFLSIGTPSGLPPVALLDGVSLTGGVPEPAVWTMMLLGFGGVGALARRRRAVGA